MMKVIIHGHRGRTLKRLLDERQDFNEEFIEDLVETDPGVRQAALDRVEPHTRMRLRRRVEAELARRAAE